MKKITVKEQFAEVAEVLRGVEREDLAEFIEGRIAQLEKKTASKKATAQQEANEVLKTKIVEFLTASGARYRAGELATEFNDSTTRISALLTQLVKAGTIQRVVEKKVAYFSI